MGQASDVVNRFYEVTNARRAKDLPPLVSDDVTFVGPLMQVAGAGEYVAMNEQLLGFHAGTRMLHQFEDGDDVCSIYELDMKTPAGDSITLTMADWIRVGGGKVISQRIYFDPREFAQAFGM
jgi:ketosteroid isomerase-like protein